jgi:polyketide synthase PksL
LTGAHLGGQADVVTVPECQLALKPESVDFEAACAYPAAYLAASRIFKRAEVKAGDTILIQAAASSNGLMAVRFAQERGATVIATASTATKLDHLRRLGVQHVVNYTQEDFAAKVVEVTQGRGVDVVVNSLSGDAVQKGLQLLAPGGRYIELAIAGLTTGAPIDLSHLTDNQSFHSIDVRKQMQREPAQWASEMAAMAQHLARGFAMPKIARVLALADIRRAYEQLRDRHSVGKVVVVTGARPSVDTADELDDREIDRLLDELRSGSLTPEEAVLREGGSPGRAASYPQPF